MNAEFNHNFKWKGIFLARKSGRCQSAHITALATMRKIRGIYCFQYFHYSHYGISHKHGRTLHRILMLGLDDKKAAMIQLLVPTGMDSALIAQSYFARPLS